MKNLYEEIKRIQEIMQVDEMAYPVDFNFEEYNNIRSFAGKIKYANVKLLGKVGAGSGRAVFRVDDEKVMKIALNSKGVQQNTVESEGYKQNYDAVAKVFDIDNDYAWIEMELAKKITPNRFKQLCGISIDQLMNWLGHIYGKGGYEDPLMDLEDNEFAMDLLSFTSDYDYPIPGDFGRISTYGEVLRNGVPTLVVVDFGFDSETSEYYHNARKQKQRYRY
jgi:hypothetical protein